MTAAHHIVIVGFPPAQMLDVTGPLDVFAVVNSAYEAAGKPAPYRLTLAAPEQGALATTSGVSLLATRSVFEADLAPDTLLIAGGRGAREASADGELMAVLAGLCDRAGRIASICTGAFPLAATGRLNDRPATTHWAHFDEFAEAFPTIRLDRDALFIGGEGVWCSAGISAGIDFSLHLVQADLGPGAALEAAKELVVFLKRPGGQSQFSSHLLPLPSSGRHERFAELLRWVQDHLGEDLRIERLAEKQAMSVRNFSRRFAEATGLSPAHYVLSARLDAARRLLTGSDLAIKDVAHRCGFPSADAMRLTFALHLRVTPSEFRERFRSAD